MEAQIRQLSDEIMDLYQKPKQTRKKEIRKLQSLFEGSPLENNIIKFIENQLIELDLEREKQISRTKRFRSIPNIYPSPNYSDELDKLIYSRFILGYTMMPTGGHARRLKASFKKLKGPSKYVEYCLSLAKLKSLNGKNFQLLCKQGSPESTHEWLFVNELSHLISDQNVINESKRLLSEYGF